MDPEMIKEKIRLAKEAVNSEEEPYKTEAFKIILSQLLQLHNTEVKKISQAVSKDTMTDKFSFSGVSKNIQTLISEGFFNEPKLLKDVKSELEKNSCFYDIRTVDKSLRLTFVKNNKILTRIKNGPRWSYVIRK